MKSADRLLHASILLIHRSDTSQTLPATRALDPNDLGELPREHPSHTCQSQRQSFQNQTANRSYPCSALTKVQTTEGSQSVEKHLQVISGNLAFILSITTCEKSVLTRFLKPS